MFKLIEVVPPSPPELLEEVRRLFLEYAGSLGLDLEFQGFTRELETLPGEYAPPRGCLFLAWPGSTAVSPEPRATTGVPPAAPPEPSAVAGCIALRPMGGEICEMKRLYVRPAYRGQGLGRTLSLRLIQEAGRLGYRRMRLDTLASMGAATRLYRSLGFREIAPYYHNPLPAPLFFERPLP